MNATEKHVAMAAQMYECRAAARRLLGDKFQERMEERARIVMAVAKRDNCNDIVAGATIIKETGAHGMDALLMMAAVVEMTEPSNVELTGAAAALLPQRPATEGSEVERRVVRQKVAE